MKILTIIYDLDKGGTQRAAQIFAESYKKIGHDSRMLSLYGLGCRYDEIKDYIKVWHTISEENLIEIKQWNPDIIHIHSHGPKEEDINRILDYLKNDHIKIIEQNVFSKPSPWAKRIDVSFQLSNWALWLFNMRGGNKFKTAIVPYPVDCSKFCCSNDSEIKKFKDTYNIPQDALVIGRIGQSFTGKWSLVLVDSFNKLAKIYSNLYLVVVNPSANIIKEVNKSEFKNRIIHIPKIYGDKALSIAYSSFELMVHTAEQGESFGYVLAESILCGTPVITLSTPWGDNSQCEVVGNYKGGYVVNNLRGIVSAVQYYFDNPDQQIALKRLGREHIYSNYDCIKVANEALENALYYKNDNKDKTNIIRNKIDIILKDTFDNKNLLARLFMKTNILFFRRLTLYNYPLRILLPVMIKKIFKIKE
ncbi:MAG: glycosyltransferase family 4 protein [Candidatus Magasanikiibacteriota bacterium]